MSNHFTGLSLGPPLGDQRLDLCDLYVFPAADPTRTAIILNANPSADEFHPDAIYRLNIDNDGDCLTDLAFTYVFSPKKNGKQTASVFVAKGSESRSAEPVGTKIIADAEVSLGAKPNIVKSGNYTFFAGSRSDAFFFDFDGIKNLYDIRGGRNFTAPHLGGGKSPWTGKDSGTEANVLSTVIELPTSELGGKPGIRIWGRCSVRRDGKLLHVDRAGHPSVSSFFNTDDTKEEYNASEPVNDRKRWLELFIHLMGHTGNYSREEAIAAIDAHSILPDMLSYDPTRPAQYPNGRVFADDVINHRLSFLSKGEIPPDGLQPHTDVLKDFPYLGTPHPTKS
jgi:hypothetical protein